MKQIIVIFIFIILPSISYCQVEKQLVPSDLKQLTIVTEPVTLRKGFFRAGFALSYGVVDKYFTDAGKKDYFLNSAWGSSSSYTLVLQYGLTNRIQVEASSDYMNTLHESQSAVFVPSADTTAIYSFTLKGHGIGDSYISLKYQILPEGDSKSSFTGRVDITLPTGEKNPTNIKSATNFDPAVGNGNFATALNLTYRKIRYPYSYTGYIGYTYKFNATKLINATDLTEKKFKDGGSFEAGGSFNFHLNDWIALANEINFYHREKNKIENIIPAGSVIAWAVSYQPQLVFQIKKFRLGEAVRIPLKGKNISADPQYVIIFQYLF
jgi:hypothetical protein